MRRTDGRVIEHVGATCVHTCIALSGHEQALFRTTRHLVGVLISDGVVNNSALCAGSVPIRI